MSAADTYVRARIDTYTKERAAEALAAMGLSISDAIRLLMLRIADEHRLPFEVKVPNATTRKAMRPLITTRCEAPTGKPVARVRGWSTTRWTAPWQNNHLPPVLIWSASASRSSPIPISPTACAKTHR